VGSLAEARLSLRLAGLSHDELVELATSGCIRDANLRNTADAMLAAREPVPPFAVSAVLTSEDLVPHIMTSVRSPKQGRVASVCKAWAKAWMGTRLARRQLHEVKFCEPDFYNPSAVLAASPDGQRLCIMDKTSTVYDPDCGKLRVVDQQLGTLHNLDHHMLALQCVWSVAMSDGSVYFCATRIVTPTLSTIYRIDLTSNEVVRTMAPTTEFNTLRTIALAPNDLLFAGGRFRNGLVALDAMTLEERIPFFGGHVLANGPVRAMVVVNEELYVSDERRAALQVFSLRGEHLREVQGAWRQPAALCFREDRLYLIERPYGEEAYGGPLPEVLEGELVVDDRCVAGDRIFVLTLQGETLCITSRYELSEPADDVDDSVDGLVTFADQLLCSHTWLTAFEGL